VVTLSRRVGELFTGANGDSRDFLSVSSCKCFRNDRKKRKETRSTSLSLTLNPSPRGRGRQYAVAFLTFGSRRFRRLVCKRRGEYYAFVRKRIVIGFAAAVVVIGVGVFFFSQPKRGSVEWHKREYLKASHWGIADEGVFRYGSQNWKNARFERKEERIESHRKALIDLGYLEARTIIVYNRGAFAVLSNVVANYSVAGLNEDFLSFEDTNTNVIRLVTVKQDVSRWEELIKTTDVPPGGK